MDAETIGAVALGAAVLACLWRLHRDMGMLRKDLGGGIRDLSDRVARVENRVLRARSALAGDGLKVVPEPAAGIIRRAQPAAGPAPCAPAPGPLPARAGTFS